MSSKFGTRKITANQMVELERIFHEESISEDADGLDMDQFVKVFESVLGGIDDKASTKNDKLDNKNDTNNDIVVDKEEEANSKRYLTHLFMKIDANSDGTVDWEEFLNFLLLENQGLESSNFHQQRDTLIRETMQCDNYHSNHSDMISSILHFPNQSRYVSGSLDGTIKLWDSSTFQIKKTIINSPDKSWVMDLLYLPLSNQIAAISMDGIINIYSSTGWKLNCQFMNKAYVLGEKYGDSFKKFNKEEQRWLITSTPVCGDASILNGNGNGNNELLSVGTESGKAFLYILNADKFHICCGDQSLAPNQASIKNQMYKWNKRRNNNNNNIAGNTMNEEEQNIINPILSCSHLQPNRYGVTPNIMDIHNDWITNIKYNRDLQSLVTCSLDSQIKFSDIERRKKTRIYMGHSHGVHSFAYNAEYKFMASCGVERKIHIFDPHRCARLQLLVGHNTSISHILMNEERHQIISLSSDKVIKIWDTRNFRCLQTLHDDCGYQPDNRISALLFDNDSKRLITCSSRLQSWPIRFESQKSEIKSHDDGVSAAYFNKHFEQCVSSDFAGNIHVWDIADSSRVFRYNTGYKEKITALAFDTSQRRVITGSDMGSLKMWNFSSGQCLCEFRDHDSNKYAHWKMDGDAKCREGTEITGIVYVMEVTSWTKKDVKHWFESFRDKELRNVGNILIDAGLCNGAQLLELNHDILLNKYCIKNIIFRRKILNSISSLYQSNIASRYIVSAGWDNKIRVWIDSSSNKAIQHPISVMPSERNKKQSSQNEILCLTHYPPVYVITGGSDGSIAIWNVVSGHFLRKESYPLELSTTHDSACVQVSWLAEYKLIVTAHSNPQGTIIFWNPNDSSSSSTLQQVNVTGWRHTSHKTFGGHGITCMVTAKKSTIIVIGDNSSMLQIFDISSISEINKSESEFEGNMDLKKYIHRLNIWCSGHSNITCIDYLDNKDLILTCGYDGEIILWNNKGFKIGMFGQMTCFNKNPIPKLWNLNDCKTFIDKESRSDINNIIHTLDTPETKKNKNNNNDNYDDNDENNDNSHNKENLNNVKISDNTLKLINNQNDNDKQNQNENDLLLSSPELHAMLQKPVGFIRQKKRNILQGALNRQLKTFQLDDIPKESPFL